MQFSGIDTFLREIRFRVSDTFKGFRSPKIKKQKGLPVQKFSIKRTQRIILFCP